MTNIGKSKSDIGNWIEEIGAGTGSKTEKEIDALGNQLNLFLEEQNKAFKKSSVEYWNGISNSAQSSDMLNPLAKRLKPELLYSFGQLLIKKSPDKIPDVENPE